MPWYDEDEEYVEQAPVSSTVELQVDCREKNPYVCTLEIRVLPEKVPGLKSLYSPLLQWIDPAFKLIQIDKQEKGPHAFYLDDQNTVENVKEMYTNDHLSTQSLSVVLFLREETKYQLNARFAKSYLDSPPWVFHHKIELASRADMRPVARQDYYESSPDLPLWTVSSVHYGNEQLRFNIFVKHFEKMKEFYKVLTGTETSASKPGFCTFDLYSQPGLEIKLSLKYSPCLQPYPSTLSALKFSVPDILDTKRKLDLTLTPHGDSTWLARDPDDNAIVLSRDESNWCDECLSECQFTEVSDSGRWTETPSENSSWEMCSEADSEELSCESGCESISDYSCISV